MIHARSAVVVLGLELVVAQDALEIVLLEKGGQLVDRVELLVLDRVPLGNELILRQSAAQTLLRGRHNKDHAVCFLNITPGDSCTSFS